MKTLTNILKGGAITVIATIVYLAGGYIMPLIAGIIAWIDNFTARLYGALPHFGYPANSYDMLVNNIWFFTQDLITTALVCGIPAAAAYYIAARLSIAFKVPPAYSIFPLSFLMLFPIIIGVTAIVISVGTVGAYGMFFLVLGQLIRVVVVLFCLEQYFTFAAQTKRRKSQIS